MEETVMEDGEEVAVIEDSENAEVQVTLMSQQHGVVATGCWRQRCERLGEHLMLWSLFFSSL
jgi:hypothetical protein